MSRQETPAEREGLDGWAKEWASDLGADLATARRIVDAMARYTTHLQDAGISPRKLSGVYSDLNAAGWIVMFDVPTFDRCLEDFSEPPSEYTFRRRFTDSPSALKRYRANLTGFAEFLTATGLVDG